MQVNGRGYFIGDGGWLDEDALRLKEVGPVTYPRVVVGIYPMAYRLVGVSPRRILVLKNRPSHALSTYSVLWGQLLADPIGYCRYADLYDHSRPGVCRRSHFASPTAVPAPRDEDSQDQ